MCKEVCMRKHQCMSLDLSASLYFTHAYCVACAHHWSPGVGADHGRVDVVQLLAVEQRVGVRVHVPARNEAIPQGGVLAVTGRCVVREVHEPATRYTDVIGSVVMWRLVCVH